MSSNESEPKKFADRLREMTFGELQTMARVIDRSIYRSKKSNFDVSPVNFKQNPDTGFYDVIDTTEILCYESNQFRCDLEKLKYLPRHAIVNKLPITQSSDEVAAGLVLYALTGQPPFTGRNYEELVENVDNKNFTVSYLDARIPELAECMQSVIKRHFSVLNAFDQAYDQIGQNLCLAYEQWENEQQEKARARREAGEDVDLQQTDASLIKDKPKKPYFPPDILRSDPDVIDLTNTQGLVEHISISTLEYSDSVLEDIPIYYECDDYSV